MTRMALVLMPLALACGPRGPTEPIQAPTAHITKAQCVRMIDHAFDVLAREGHSDAEEKRVRAKAPDSLDQCAREVTRQLYDCVMKAEKGTEAAACN